MSLPATGASCGITLVGSLCKLRGACKSDSKC